MNESKVKDWTTLKHESVSKRETVTGEQFKKKNQECKKVGFTSMENLEMTNNIKEQLERRRLVKLCIYDEFECLCWSTVIALRNFLIGRANYDPWLCRLANIDNHQVVLISYLLNGFLGYDTFGKNLLQWITKYVHKIFF